MPGFLLRTFPIVLVLSLGCAPAEGDGESSSGDLTTTLGTTAATTTTAGTSTTAGTTTAGTSTTSGDTEESGEPESTSSDEATTSAIPIDLGTQEPGTYVTDFPLEEDPISENGAWSAIANPWLRIRTTGGVAKPDAYVTGYNDNYAILSGFAPDVQITATVFIEGDAPFGEILLLARMAHTETTNRGYEFLYDGDGSVQLMRWNGGEGDFTPMGGEQLNPGPLQDFDQLRMRVVGDTITIFHRREPGDWVQIGETVDDTFADGEPGMGFFVRDEGQTIDGIGLRDYAVEAI